MTGDVLHDAFGQSLIAREVATTRQSPAPPGSGPNSGELARAQMQNDATAFAALGTRYPLPSGAGAIAKVDPSNVQLHGRGGWNPALVELQANPKPLPWETRFAKTTSEPSAQVQTKP